MEMPPASHNYLLSIQVMPFSLQRLSQTRHIEVFHAVKRLSLDRVGWR
jgi:hypothetical protein